MKYNNKNLLQKKIIKRIFQFSFIFLIGILISDFVFSSVSIEKELKKIAIQTSVKNEEAIEEIINKYKSLLEAMAHDPNFTDKKFSMEKRIHNALPYDESMGLEAIGISNSKGDIYLTSENIIKANRLRKYFQNCLNKKKVIISSVISSKVSSKKVYIICVPVLDKRGSISSILCGIINFEEIQNMIETENKVFYSFILNKNFKLLAHSFNKNRIGKNLFDFNEVYFNKNNKNIKNNIKNNSTGSFYSYSPKNLTIYFTTYNHIKNTNWVIFTKININKYLESIVVLFITKIIITCILFVVIIKLLNNQIKKKITPVDEFLTAASNITKSNISNSTELSKVFKYSKLAFEDPITNTLRREIFLIQGEELLKSVDTFLNTLLLFIDLDNLKGINDYLGHEYGDKAILEFSIKIKIFLNKYDFIISRFGGDEFLVLIENLTKNDLEYIRDNINKALTGELVSENKIQRYSASIGGAIYNLKNNYSLNILINYADSALYVSKSKGKNCITYYNF
ncbi:diguanylate cyclase (GGDEF) domain-containing protein [Cetobacterium ceti]|uniref:Diguanylate cyclase (GGDEF) domain-containing protein n=1 Tax=Cetobacterium ceti TaxID=180163 RepID=A0A1T4PB86_9FUSO|nr:diguanylate cyclase [Cetobacterium ceti]SJZ88088.1 diguanylate cyclase (GGDEF) domain-containing protein [Cetobacterium ceti]